MPSVLPPLLAGGAAAVSWMLYQGTTTFSALVTHLSKFRNGRPEDMEAIYDSHRPIADLAPGVTREDAYNWGKLLFSEEWSGKERKLWFSHNALSLPWGLLSALQFSQAIRQKNIEFHRWNGRVIFLSLIPTALTGFKLTFNSKAHGNLRGFLLGLFTAGYTMRAAVLSWLAVGRPPVGRKKASSVAIHQYYATKLAIFIFASIPITRFVFPALMPLINAIPGVKDKGSPGEKLSALLGSAQLFSTALGVLFAEIWGAQFERSVGKRIAELETERGGDGKDGKEA